MVSAEMAVDAYLEAVKQEGSIMGPVFFRLFSKYAVEWTAGKLGEKPPAIEDIDGARNYIIEACKRDPDCQLSLGYGCAKAEAAIQGAVGPIMRRIVRATVKQLLDITGMAEEAGKIDAYTAASKLIEFLASIQFCKPDDYALHKDTDTSLTFSTATCPVYLACQGLTNEGIKRIIGQECRLQSMVASSVELLLGRSVDYRVTSKDPPKCSGQVTVM